MFGRLLIGATVVGLLSFSATLSFALSPQLCEPNDDPDNCECSPGVDECYEIAPKNLISPDNAAALKGAAGITSYWDSNLNAFVIEADATGPTAAGVMKLNSNRGQWKS